MEELSYKKLKKLCYDYIELENISGLETAIFIINIKFPHKFEKVMKRIAINAIKNNCWDVALYIIEVIQSTPASILDYIRITSDV